MKIFIAGCARSGTSLARGLMGCFADTYVHGGFSYDQEAPESMFNRLDRSERHLVVKRVLTSYLTLPSLASDVALIYCVRHPLDVLTSSHPSVPDRPFYVSEPRWRAEYAAYRLLCGLQPSRRTFVLRYEDLVGDPDGMQRRIAHHFGLDIARPFTENAEGVPVRRSSVEKWRTDPGLRDYIDSFDASFRGVIGAFCGEFGYTLPVSFRAWYPPFLRAATWRATWRELRAPRIDRLDGNPIIRPEMLPGDIGCNINGPSLIRAPAWLPNRLGRYYLYFAHHNGDHIRLAYADSLSGPWHLHAPGTLQLADVPQCKDHIASPDVHVHHRRRRIRMYFHGPLREQNSQATFVASSRDGITFKPRPDVVSGPYFKAFRMKGAWWGVDQPGHIWRSEDGLSGFVRRPVPLPFAFGDVKAIKPVTLRHLALQRVGRTLHLYYTRRGDAPERIWRARVDLTSDWTEWAMADETVVLEPERPWEGGELPIVQSEAGPAKGYRNELRDPAVFSVGGKTYLLYAVAGEAGIAIARVR